jgi:hypothetical protein
MKVWFLLGIQETNKYDYTLLGLATGSNKGVVLGRMVSEAEPSEAIWMILPVPVLRLLLGLSSYLGTVLRKTYVGYKSYVSTSRDIH